MKKFLLSFLLSSCVFLSNAQDNQNGIIIESDDGSVITIEGDSGTSIIVGGGYDDSSYNYVDSAIYSMSRKEPNRSAVYRIEDVPNPKTSNNTWVSDPDHYLQASTIAEINQLLNELDQKTTDQVAVVVLNSIGEEIPKTFAYELFNKWGIGVRGKNNGLLILMIMDQRRVEFETGYGMESMLPDAICKRIQMNYMIPEFKAENYDRGLLEGVKATVDILSNPENSKIAAELKEEIAKETDEERLAIICTFGAFYALAALIVYISKRKKKTFKHNFDPDSNNYPKAISHRRWLVIYVAIPLLYSIFIYSFYDGESFAISYFMGCYLIALLFFLEKRTRLNSALKKTKKEGDHYANYLAYTNSHKHWWVAALFFPFIFIFYLLMMQSKKAALRNHPRNCKKCQQPAHKLGEQEDDQHLKKTQILEEGLRSIDYDVWLCSSCGAKEVLAYVNSFSKYSNCRSCNVKSSYLFSDRTITSATYSSTGTGCKTYKCKNCSYEREETYVIPMKTSSSSSGGGGGGGSFGGGSSGGGGSGSSW